jgi:type I site-specific restriction-modification system R (restriction) subunit
MSKSDLSSCKHAALSVFNLEQIRQAGICNHYENLKNQGLSAQDCLKKTTEFAGISPKQAKGILTGNIQPTGKKEFPKTTIEEYLYKLDEIMAPDKPDISDLNTLRNKVKKDARLYDELKKALSKMIENDISQAKVASKRHDSEASKQNISELDFKKIIEDFLNCTRDDLELREDSKRYEKELAKLKEYFFPESKNGKSRP